MSATNRGDERIVNDRYMTPASAVTPLLDLIDFSKITSFMEPCVGQGVISKLVIERAQNKKFDDYDYFDVDIGRDYLSDNLPHRKFDLIITNPPYSLAEEFLRNSLNEASTVCYLLRINFLGSKKRISFFEEFGTPNKLLVLSERPSFFNKCKYCQAKNESYLPHCRICGGDSFVKGTDATEYAWFCWDKSDVINVKEGITII